MSKVVSQVAAEGSISVYLVQLSNGDFITIGFDDRNLADTAVGLVRQFARPGAYTKEREEEFREMLREPEVRKAFTWRYLEAMKDEDLLAKGSRVQVVWKGARP